MDLYEIPLTKLCLEINCNMRYLLSYALLLCFFCPASAQYEMDGTPINDCDGQFYDSGGPNGNYGAFENLRTTICPDNNLGMQIRLVLSGIDLGFGDELCFFDGMNTNAPLLSCITNANNITNLIIQATDDNASGCITVEFDSDFLFGGDGWESTISCIPKCQSIEALLVSSDPPVNPVDTGWIDVCPGQEVFFSAAGFYPESGTVYNQSDASSTFYWEFGDGGNANGREVSYTFEESGGYIVQVYIRDSFECRNTNFISQRVRVAPAPDFEIITPPGPICVGDSVQLLANVGSIDPSYTVSVQPQSGTFFRDPVRSDSLPLPDGDGAAYETTISIFDFAPGQTLTDLNDLLDICVNMEHSYLNDLEIKITCPSGNEVILQNQESFINEVFLGEPYQLDDVNTPTPPGMGLGYDYCWTPTATRGTWTSYIDATGVQTLPAGDYNSYESLSALLGCPLNGEWMITVTDLWENDNGWIFQWSINFDPDIYPAPEVFTPEITDFNWRSHADILQSTDTEILVSPQSAGRIGYTFQITNAFGCPYDTTVYLDVLPPTHPDCEGCAALSTPLRDTIVCMDETLLLDAGNLQNLNQQQISFAADPMVFFGFNQYPPTNALESTIAVNSVVPIQLTNASQQIQSVCVEIEHAYAGDVSLWLRAPNGILLELSTFNGGNGADYVQTCFRPNATSSITSGIAPFTGSFQPEGSWNILNGSDINGNWTLLIADENNSMETGRIINWSIEFDYENNYTLNWLPNGIFNCADCSQQLVQIQSDTSFVVSIQDDFNCQFFDTVYIQLLDELPAPVIDCQFGGPGILIFTWNDIPGATQYEVSLDGGINWQPSNLPLGHQVTGLSLNEAVQISVRAIALGECDAEIGLGDCIYEGCTFSIDALSILEPTCADRDDGAIRLGFSGGFGPVEYYIGNIGPFTDSLTGLIAGDYEIRAIDNLGCMDTINIRLNAPAELEVNLLAQPITCQGAADGEISSSVSGGTAAYTYNWNLPAGNTSPQITGLPPGTYELTVTDANGCSSSRSITLDDPELLTIDVTFSDASCFGGNDGMALAIPNGGSTPYSYQWSNNTSGSTANNLNAGAYTLTITDASNCTATTSFNINHSPELILQSQDNSPICFGSEEGNAIVLASGGIAPYAFLWSNNDTTSESTNLAAGTYQVTVTDAANCSKVIEIDLSERTEIIIELEAIRPACFGESNGQITVLNVSGGNGNSIDDYTFSWNDPNATSEPQLTNLGGNQTYALTVTDSDGCSAMSTVRLAEPRPIQLILDGEPASCYGGNDGTVTLLQATGEYNDFTYLWSTQDTSTSLSALTAGQYSLTVTDSSGCSVDTSIWVLEPEEIYPIYEVNANSCHEEDDASLSVQAFGGFPGYEYQWSTGSDSTFLDQLETAWYLLTITDARGCTVVDSVWTGEDSPLTARLLTKPISCHGENDGIISVFANQGNPPYRYSLNGGNYSDQNTWSSLPPDYYIVSVEDGEGCTWEEEFELIEPLRLSVDAGEDLEIELGDSIQLSANVFNPRGEYTLEWVGSFGSTLSCGPNDSTCHQPFAFPLNTIVYKVYVQDESGCSAEATIQVRVKKGRSILVPTGFSPNGDSHNDLLNVHGKNPRGTQIRSFKVFDRWGEKLFEANDFAPNDRTIGWDGYFKGKAMNPGVFVWIVEVEYLDGYTEVYKGNTTLVR